MPIRGMTDQHTPGRGMVRIGTLNKGAERTPEDIAKNRPGKDLDYFRVQFTPEREGLHDVWEALYGKEPKWIGGAYLLAHTPDDALSAWKEEWGKSGLYHRCDGAQQVAWYNEREGRVVREGVIACAAPACACKQIGRLNVFLPDFVRLSGLFGYFTLQTHSIRDIRSLSGLLQDASLLIGDLMGVPFTLSRVQTEIELPEMKGGKPTGKRMHVKKSLISINLDPGYVRGELAKRLAYGGELPEPAVTPALIDTTTGEKRLPAGSPVSRQWSEAEARQWVADMHERSYSDSDLLQALEVEKFMLWQGSAADATLAVSEWTKAIMDAEMKGES